GAAAAAAGLPFAGLPRLAGRFLRARSLRLALAATTILPGLAPLSGLTGLSGLSRLPGLSWFPRVAGLARFSGASRLSGPRRFLDLAGGVVQFVAQLLRAGALIRQLLRFAVARPGGGRELVGHLVERTRELLRRPGLRARVVARSRRRAAAAAARFLGRRP